MQSDSTSTMLKTRHNILQLLKALHLPVETDNLTLEYAVQQMWPRIAQTLQLTMQEESDKNAESFNRQLEHSEDLAIEQTTDDVWVFGYGSLIWKVDFPYIDRRKGYICGYQRRFYQQSIDHRGTHVQPGRVVTLLPTSNVEDRVYGVAYRIAAQQKEKVLQHLDYREKNGYERCALDFHVYPEQLHEQFELIMYIATKDNQSYAGHINRIEDIAMQIFISAGPSGTNREYLFNLANAMRAHFPDVNDEHLFELEEEVLNLIRSSEQCFLKKAVWQQVNAIIEGDKLNSEKAEKAISKLFALCQQRGGKEALLRQVVQLK